MGWWPFSRRQKAAPGVETPPASHGDTSAEAWAVGDLAECVSTGRWLSPSGDRREGPEKGDVYLVTGVCVIGGERGLQFTRFEKHHFYHSICFRKVTPRADTAEAADADFVALLTKVQP